jgi:hypothetical protein
MNYLLYVRFIQDQTYAMVLEEIISATSYNGKGEKEGFHCTITVHQTTITGSK